MLECYSDQQAGRGAETAQQTSRHNTALSVLIYICQHSNCLVGLRRVTG